MHNISLAAFSDELEKIASLGLFRFTKKAQTRSMDALQAAWGAASAAPPLPPPRATGQHSGLQGWMQAAQQGITPGHFTPPTAKAPTYSAQVPQAKQITQPMPIPTDRLAAIRAQAQRLAAMRKMGPVGLQQ